VKRTLAFLIGLLFLIAQAVHAQFDYSTNGSTITLTKYRGSGGAVNISNFVTIIGGSAFFESISLTSVTIPNSVTSIGAAAFFDCSSLHGVYFLGNAPAPDFDVFLSDGSATAYYLPGTIGWSTIFDGIPTALSTLPGPIILNNSTNFGTQPGGFSFTVSWATNAAVIVEGSTNLAAPNWQPLQTNTMTATNGVFNFSDADWSNYQVRFYRIVTQ
jgi:hypothetical protein